MTCKIIQPESISVVRQCGQVTPGRFKHVNSSVSPEIEMVWPFFFHHCLIWHCDFSDRILSKYASLSSSSPSHLFSSPLVSSPYLLISALLSFSPFLSPLLSHPPLFCPLISPPLFCPLSSPLVSSPLLIFSSPPLLFCHV